MSKKKTYAVFGLGRYGVAVARELVSNGMEVIAVDSDEKIVNAVADELSICNWADITDPDVLRQRELPMWTWWSSPWPIIWKPASWPLPYARKSV